MTNHIITPLTQALEEGALKRCELKQLMRRYNTPAIIRFALLLITMAMTATLIWLSKDTVFFVPAMLLHGVVLVHHFSLQHECIHYTAFRTRWLNDLIGNYCGLVIMLPNRFFRYEHCDHHTYTQVTGRDPEMIALPVSIWGYLYYLSSIPYWKVKFSELASHCAGKLSAAEKIFTPKTEYRSVIIEARMMALFYSSVLCYCVTTDWWAPVWYWWLPVVLGEPIMRAIRMTEHVGRPTVTQMKINTRSNIVNPFMQFLCWNMNYHAAHHYVPSVPFHALPKLHRTLADYVHIEERGYIGAHVDIISQILGRQPRADHRS